MAIDNVAIFSKNRNRELQPDFANINLLGRCNAKCFFCLGKDLGQLIDGRSDTGVHFRSWPNWDKFIDLLHEKNIKKVYVTGQNTDALLYKHLDQLIDELHELGFGVGLRTNGLLAEKKIGTINKCDLSCGYSIHSLRVDTNTKIMGWPFVLDWDELLSKTERPRVAIVVNRYNVDEFFEIVKLVSLHKNVRYMQARRISTDNRQDELLEDVLVYEELHSRVAQKYGPPARMFHGAPIYNIEGVECTFWRTVKTTISSVNYFTDGVLSNVYFVVEGYKNSLSAKDRLKVV